MGQDDRAAAGGGGASGPFISRGYAEDGCLPFVFPASCFRLPAGASGSVNHGTGRGVLRAGPGGTPGEWPRWTDGGKGLISLGKGCGR